MTPLVPALHQEPRDERQGSRIRPPAALVPRAGAPGVWPATLSGRGSAFLGRLSAAANILLLGEGDGRCAERLAEAGPRGEDPLRRLQLRDDRARRGEDRRHRPAERRVAFVCADARRSPRNPGATTRSPPSSSSTALTRTGWRRSSRGSSRGAAPGRAWLFADFALPPRGLAPLRARAWLGVLYAFFRSQTGCARAACRLRRSCWRGRRSGPRVVTSSAACSEARCSSAGARGAAAPPSAASPPYWSSSGICMTRADRESSRLRPCAGRPARPNRWSPRGEIPAAGRSSRC